MYSTGWCDWTRIMERGRGKQWWSCWWWQADLTKTTQRQLGTPKVAQRSKRHLRCATCRFANGQVGFQPRPHGFCLKKWPTHFFKEKPLGRGRSVFRSAPASFTVFAISWLILPSYMVVVNLVTVIKMTIMMMAMTMSKIMMMMMTMIALMMTKMIFIIIKTVAFSLLIEASLIER